MAVFGCSLGAALIGTSVRLPERHLNTDSRDLVKLVMGLIATMSALVLSLLIASANSSYEQQKNELNALSANIVLLDRTLEFYGPDAKEVRDHLRDLVQQTHDRIWSADGVRPEMLASVETQSSAKANIERLLGLVPKTDLERAMLSRAIQQSDSIGRSRLLMTAQLGSSIAWPFLTVLVFWICMLFLGFGLFARFNVTVTIALLVGALSVASAIFLILELSSPYTGAIRLSSAGLDRLIQVLGEADAKGAG